MTRWLLRTLNPVTLLFFVVMGVAVQTSLFTFWILPYVQPDLILIGVIWCALRRKILEGGIITLTLAEIAEVNSAAPAGTYFVVYMATYLVLRLAAHLLVIPDHRSYVLVTFISSVLGKLVSLGIAQLMGVDSIALWPSSLIFVFSVGTATATLSYWLYRWLDRFDWITFKHPRAEKALDEELLLETSEF